MPLVQLRYRPQKGLEMIVYNLSRKLPEIIAQALDVPRNPWARLKPEDIEIVITQNNEMDVNVKDLSIIVFAHDYPQRTRGIEGRKNNIVAGIKEFLKQFETQVTGWVWILPQQSSAFGKI